MNKLILSTGLTALSCMPALAQGDATQPPRAAVSYQSDYREDATVLGGPSAVQSELGTLDEARDSLYRVDLLTQTFTPWFDWKRDLKNASGIKLGLNALFLYQYANEKSPQTERKHAGGGIYRFQGSWNAFEGGALEWRLEARHDLGGPPSPQQHGGEFMSALTPGFPYGNDFDADLSVFAWKHTIEEAGFGYSIGRLVFDAYLDAFATQTPYGGFLNRSFVYNPTLATTGAGALGAVAKGFVSDQIWIGGQIYDGNASNGDWDFDTFKEHEWLKAVEVGWTPGRDRRARDRVQLSYWQKDARDAAGTSKGWGWALSASYQWTEALMPFLRVGHSDGGAGVAAENAISSGVQYDLSSTGSLALGVGWAQPSRKTHGRGLEDEWVVETSYKIQLTPNFSLMPDLQLLLNPARAPKYSALWIGSIRAVLTL